MGAASVPHVDDSDRDELRGYVADVAELTAAMHRRQNLGRDSPEWKEALEVEERLIARIQRSAQQQYLRRTEE